MEYAVIMAGGAGTRLWPAARRSSPKQFQRLIFSRPLIAETAHRLLPLYPWERILVVTAARYAEDVAEALPELPPANILAEPFGRNTCPALALAALHLSRDDPDALFAALPADHVVLHPEGLLAALRFGTDLARRHTVADIGVRPDHPATGYGYIQLGDPVETHDGLQAFAVRSFVEKPDRERAAAYLATGDYMWNSGIFLWRATAFLDALRALVPEIHDALAPAVASGDRAALDDAYERLPDISVDYALMERVDDVVAIPADFGWRDIGDWAALYDMMPHDRDGNAATGPHMALDSHNSLLMAGAGRLVAAVGVEDLIIVDTPDALLVMRRDRSQQVKQLLDALRAAGHDQLL